MVGDFLAGPDGPADPHLIDVPVTERGVVTGRDGVRRRRRELSFLVSRSITMPVVWLTFALSRAAQRHLTTDGKPRRLQRKLDLVCRHYNSG